MAKRTLVDPVEQMVKDLKRTKEWHHDIKYIDGKFVEEVVKDFQESGDENLIIKIISNFAIFRKRWGYAFAMYLDSDIEDGELMHDTIVWRSATKFEINKARKKNGKSFNAYLVSALLNQSKNLRNARMSHKNHPRAQCPLCEELVFQVDAQHLKHILTLKRYKKMYPNFPLTSYDGMTICPITGVPQERITMEYMNRFSGYYTMKDFNREYKIRRKGPYKCPITGTTVKELTDEYFRGLLSNYSAEQFAKQYPQYPGLLTCPFTGKRIVNITQQHLDEVFDQTGEEGCYTRGKFDRDYPNFTIAARQIKVVNPYTGRKVSEITPVMLAKANTTLKEHLEKYKTIVLDRYTYELISCPFTGRRTHMIKRSDLNDLNKTVQDFYQATCQYPLQKFQVKCAHCGDWADNIWSHLTRCEHSYAEQMSIHDFELQYGFGRSKKTVSTNSFVESDSGDSIHIADLFAGKMSNMDHLEVEDSLVRVASDELDKKIANAVRCSHTLDDVFFLAGELCKVTLQKSFSGEEKETVRQFVKNETGANDFDIVVPPTLGGFYFEIIIPSKTTIKNRLKRMVMDSDLCNNE